MRYLFLCEIPSGPLDTLQCIFNNILNFFNIILTILIIYQIYIRLVIYKIPTHGSTILFYIMFIQTVLYNSYNILEPYTTVYLLEIYLRHIVFIYITYFFSKKAWKFNQTARRLRYLRLFLAIAFTYFSMVLLYSLFKEQERTQALCKDDFWVFLRTAGIILSFFFCAVGYKLSVQMERSLGEFQVTNQEYTYETIDEIRIISIVVYEKMKKNMRDLWRIVLFMTLSQFLSFCNCLYIIFDEVKTCEIIIPDLKHPDCSKINILNTIVMTTTKIICYFGPLVVTISIFWKNKQQVIKEELDNEEVLEGYYGNLKYDNVNFEKGVN